MNNTNPVYSFDMMMGNLSLAIGEMNFPFVWDHTGFHGMAQKYHVWLFVNGEDQTYDVTVDRFDLTGVVNVEWESYKTPEEAVKCFHLLFRKYLNI